MGMKKLVLCPRDVDAEAFDKASAACEHARVLLDAASQMETAREELVENFGAPASDAAVRIARALARAATMFARRALESLFESDFLRVSLAEPEYVEEAMLPFVKETEDNENAGEQAR